MTSPALPPFSLDAPLPDELAGRHHGCFTRYRRYPVFSRPWVMRRARMATLVVVVLILLVVVPVMVLTDQPDMPTPVGGLLTISFALLAPLWLGPWLGWQVRRRGLNPRHEWLGLVAAVSFTVLLMLALAKWGYEPVKQWVAEQRGSVDAQGKRKRVVISLGVNVSTPDEPGRTLPASTDTLTERVGDMVSLALLSFWLAGGLALSGWRRETAGLAALAQERALAQAQAQRREAELRLSVLAAQVEPHFLFNTLAGVRSAITTDPARASEMIDRLVDYLRAAIPRLRSDGSAQATVGGQLDTVRAYLGLMAARMPRLQFDVTAPDDLLAARCPPLMLISLAENAVKHGVERKVGPAHISVRAARSADGQLQLSVLDDGAGFSDAGAGSGLGLANIRERLQQLYPGRAALGLKARPQGGVEAALTLPLEFDPSPARP